MIEIPIAGMHCPRPPYGENLSRRNPRQLAAAAEVPLRERHDRTNGTAGLPFARSDYAANGGSVPYYAIKGNPNTYADWQSGAAKSVFDSAMSTANGVFFVGSETTISEITDGTSATYLVGEKYLNPDNYETGKSSGDNENMYMGDNEDILRWTWSNTNQQNAACALLPLQDCPGYGDSTGYGFRFGSAHPGGFNMAMCDGSVRTISYEIEATVHRDLGNRKDGTPMDKSGVLIWLDTAVSSGQS